MRIHQNADTDSLTVAGSGTRSAPSRDLSQFSAAANHGDLGERIEIALTKSLERFGSTCCRVVSETEDLVTVARKLASSGGKRIRARFVYWGWRAAGRPDCDEVLELAVAIEVFHLSALVHDDLMDMSDSRRGVPSAHRQLTATHRSLGWRGDADHFGMSAGVLLGDALMVWADALINTASPVAADPMRFRRAYDDMRLELIGGQYLDITADCVDRRSLTEALWSARLKSGNYTIAQPLRLGAIAGGADEQVVDGLGELGAIVGEAFQIQDDILGVFGTGESTGKPVGDDLRQGKRTALVALALVQAAPTAVRTLLELLGDPDLTADQISTAQSIIVDSGALEAARALISDRLDRARRSLAAMPIDTPVKQSLADLLTGASGG
jgi:geranylgeranyl diphosphate synthase, type I